MLHTDICIAGAGVIGISLALELQTRGLSVTVVEAARPLREASWAAAGMLAAHDPHNPSQLSALAERSISLYPKFLERVHSLGGIAVPFQTSRTLQSNNASQAFIATSTRESLLFDAATASPSLSGWNLLDERSIDPRQLANSLLAAVASTSIRLLVESPVVSTRCVSGTVQIATPTHTIEAADFVDCTGAWVGDPEYRVVPIKGQMLAVALPHEFPLKIAVRTADIYIVPRTIGPMAGHAIIGATVEDVGFDETVHPSRIEELRAEAVTLIPELIHAKVIDSWSGLRPATPDRLPILGAHPFRPHHWVATGHYRNGILLAPSTAHVMAEALLGEVPSTPLDIFAPSRLSLRNPVPR